MNFERGTKRLTWVISIIATLVYFLIKEIGILPLHQLQTVTVPRGERQSITLSDGITIALDAGSSLEYPEQFKGNTRKVFLNGKGYRTVCLQKIQR